MCPFPDHLKLAGGTGNVPTWRWVAMVRTSGCRVHRYGTVSYRNLFPGACCDLRHIESVASPASPAAVRTQIGPNGPGACFFPESGAHWVRKNVPGVPPTPMGRRARVKV